MNMHTKLTNLI